MRLTMLAALVLAGCGPTGSPDGGGVPPRLEEAGPDSCGLAENEALIGQPIDAFGESTRDGPVRIILPGDIVTMEYDPRRLNVDLDNRKRIVRFWCG